MKFVWKNYLLILGLGLASLALLTAAISLSQAARQLQDKRDEERLSATMVATQVETGYHDQVWPFEMLASLSNDPDFVYWRIVDGSGKVVLGNPALVDGDARVTVKVPQDLSGGPKLLHAEEDAEVWVVPMRMRTGGRPWTFWYGYSTLPIATQNHSFVWSSAMFGGIVAIALIPVSLLATRRMLRPVANLSQAAAQMAEGDLNVSLPPAGADEIGGLVRSFGAMADKVRRRDAEIRSQMLALGKARDELEQRVAERTAELTRANSDLQKEVQVRQRTEQVLRASETRFREVAETTGEWIWEVDAEGLYTYSSPAVEHILGYRPEELVGRMHFYDLFEPRTREEFKTAALKAVADGALFKQFVNVNIHRDGRVVVLETSGLPLRDGDGRIAGYRGVDTDITERKHVEEQIQQDIRIRTSLNNLLRLQLSNTSTGELLERFLDKVLDIPWLSLESRGAVFLMDSAAGELVLAAHRRLAPQLQTACARVKLGQCLCGRTARDCITIFCEHVDERHETTFDGISDHGHCCLPLISSEQRVLGVLNLYLRPGYVATAKDREFLDSAANVLAGLIERKRAEEAMRESREFLNKIINTIRDPIVVENDQHCFLLVNDAFAAMSGKSAQELLGKTVRDMLSPEDADVIWAKNEQAIRTGQDSTEEEQTTTRDGSIAAILTNRSVYVDPSGKRFLVGVIRDISETKRNEEALRESREFLNKIINTIRDPIFVQDDQHRFLLVNDAFCAFAGIPRERILGKTVRVMFRPEDAEAVIAKNEQVLRTGQDHIEEEHNIRKDGSIEIVLVKKSLYIDPSGKRFLVGVIRDISEIKRNEEALRESEEKYRNVVNNIGIGVAMIGPGMEILALNAQMQRWFPTIDASAHPLCHRAFNNPPSDTPCSYCPTILTLQDGQVHEATTQTPAGGEVRNYRVIASPIKDAGGKVTAAVEMVEDITERRKAEEALRQSEARFRSLFENMLEGYAYCQMVFQDDRAEDFVYLNVNHAFSKLTGLKDVAGRKVTEVIPGIRESNPEMFDIYGRVAQTGEPEAFEVRLEALGGMWLSVSAYRPEPGCIVAVFTNVTERKRAEEALLESREFLNTIINCIRDPIFVMDDQHRYELMNDAGCALAGKTREGVIGRTTWDLFPPELVESYLRVNEQVLASGQDDVTEEPIIDPQGLRMTIMTRKSRYVDPAGRPHVVGVIRDITERKHMEDELRVSRDLLEQRVVERTADLLKANEQIRQAQADLVQSEKMSMLGQLVAGVAHEINTPTGAILNVMADMREHVLGILGAGREACRLPEETVEWVLQACRRTLDAATDASEAVDRAAQRQLEQELSQRGCANARRLATILLRCFGEDWRSDQGLLDRLAVEPVQETLAHVLALRNAIFISLASGRKIARIVRALRYYSHAGHDELTEININESIDNTLVILQNRIKHVAEVAVEFDPDLPAVRCSPDISQVWTNILGNACDSIEDTHREGVGRIKVSTCRREDLVIVQISNDGPAIPEQIMGKMFDPFVTTKSVGKGTGLGLSICRGIVQRCGGSIRAINEPPWVTFEVSLPSAAANVGREVAMAAADASRKGSVA